jgi:hypothetical protein
MALRRVRNAMRPAPHSRFFSIDPPAASPNVASASQELNRCAILIWKHAHKIKRGMAGRVKQGLYAGGLAYGYAPVTGDPGKRVIVEAEADIVRRIFADYLAGKSPRKIAAELNGEGVAPPRGKSWNASTINGNRQRGCGILHNEIYGGRLVWNRVRMIRDPDTGKRVSRVDPESEWNYSDVPELAIVDGETYAKAQVLKSSRSSMTPRLQRAPRRLLSGCCAAAHAAAECRSVERIERVGAGFAAVGTGKAGPAQTLAASISMRSRARCLMRSGRSFEIRRSRRNMSGPITRDAGTWLPSRPGSTRRWRSASMG